MLMPWRFGAATHELAAHGLGCSHQAKIAGLYETAKALAFWQDIHIDLQQNRP
jgi:hypothetical protein